MQCYTELLPPTAVTHAVTLPFCSPEQENLIVAKTSLLQVFAIKSIPGDVNNAREGEKAIETKLSLIGEYQLSGTVTALKRVKTLGTQSGGEVLLIATKNAKLSLVEWDQENYRISTISIHYYEGESIATQPFGPDIRDTESVLTVDPSSRCAALKFGQRHLAILPFRQLGDDIADMEVDNDVDERRKFQQQLANGETPLTPYKASFVSTLTQIAPDLTHTLDLAFLYEYREPTLGIISSASQTSAALIEMRKDILTYTVGTLDLEQRASTVLISVQNLPSDLWKVVPLALPIGGALLVGTNELVHVDQSGKTNAVAVNEFAKLASNFGMADQSQLNLKLEDCVLEPLNNASGDILMVLRDGTLAIVRFIMQGRSVGGMQVVPVTSENGGLSPGAAPSCIASFSTNDFFVGSDVGDSVLLRSNNPATTLSRKRSHAQMRAEEQATNEPDEDDDDVEEDDLYGGAASAAQRTQSISGPAVNQPVSAYHFREVDRLQSLGPINDLCFGKSARSGTDRLEALASVGKGKGSRLAFMNRGLTPELQRKTVISGAQNIWSIAASNEHESTSEMYDNLLFVYDGASTKAYSRTDLKSEPGESNYIERTDSDFEQEGETVAIGTLANRTRIVQCRQNEIRTYDADLGLNQIIPMIDEETEAELKIVHTSFCDPFILVLRDDASMQVLQVEKNGDIEPLESEQASLSQRWLSGCLYNGVLSGGDTMLFLLRHDGGLHAFSLPNLEPMYSIPTLPHVPPVLSTDAAQRRVGAKEELTEVLIADVGPTGFTNCYMVLRNSADNLTIYQPFHADAGGQSLRWRKVPNTFLPQYEEVTDSDSSSATQLRSMSIAGHSVIAMLGAAPGFIMRHATSTPKVLPVRVSHCIALTPMHAKTCDRGFAVLDNEDNIQECRFPEGAWFGTGWVVHRQALGDPVEEVRQVAFHEERGMYVVATCRLVDFKFVDEDGRHPEQDEISLRPQVSQYTIHLFSASSHRLIFSFTMPYTESITSLKVMPLEVSETTHAQKSLVVVGSAQQRGEDMPAKGALTILELLDVVPEPGDPETGVKLSLLAREEPRGAVTAVAPLAAGLVATTQGQKILIRGLKEDGSCLPVAFLDAQIQTATFKTLSTTGLWLAGDVWKGLWLGAFTEEPYKLSVLGKSRTQMEVACAEFLPGTAGGLFVLVGDAGGELWVLQYDPEDPKSLGGSRLLHRSTFRLGHSLTGMVLVPSTLAPFAAQDPDAEAGTPEPLFHVLTTSQTGSVGLITPVDETTYRRLGAVEAHLTSILEHAAGLNPREYRAVESEGFGARGVVDGGLIQRIGELGSARRAEVLSRAGGDAWVLASDLEILGGGGLGWL